MGVISFGDNEDVWGAASVVIYDLLVFCISTSGMQPYLAAFKESFDHGYNSIELEEISIDEALEFKGLVSAYVASEAYEDLTKLGYATDDLEALLGDLVTKIDRHVRRRRRH